MAESNNATKNIYQRMNAVMADVDGIEPDKEIKMGKDGIPYISHDAVTKKLQPLFVKHGIMPVPTVLECTKDGNRTEMVVGVRFYNVDNPEDEISTTSYGYGVDSSDKGPGKAYSYAVKYAYLKVLMLNSGDDQGGEALEHNPESLRQSDVDDATKMSKAALEAAANTYKAGISGASSTKELRELKASNAEWLDGAPEVTRNYFGNLYNEKLSELKENEVE